MNGENKSTATQSEAVAQQRHGSVSFQVVEEHLVAPIERKVAKLRKQLAEAEEELLGRITLVAEIKAQAIIDRTAYLQTQNDQVQELSGGN